MFSKKVATKTASTQVATFPPNLGFFFQGAHPTFLRLAELQPHEGEEMDGFGGGVWLDLDPLSLVEVLLSHCEGRPIRPFEIGKEGSFVLIFLAPGDDSEKLSVEFGGVHQYKLQLHHNLLLHKYCLLYILEFVMIRHRPLCLCGFEALGRRRRSGVSAGELSRMEGTSRQGGGERNSKPTHQMKRTELTFCSTPVLQRITSGTVTD